jgi:hypothetical protein
VRGGRYEISAEMRCPAAEAGSRLRFDFGGVALDVTVPAADGAKNEWQMRQLGTVRMKPGRAQLTARALQVKGQGVWELKWLMIRKL